MPRKTIDAAKDYKYYCLGLNSKEIAKLLDCSFRTVQNYMNTENWNDRRKKNNCKGLT